MPGLPRRHGQECSAIVVTFVVCVRALLQQQHAARGALDCQCDRHDGPQGCIPCHTLTALALCRQALMLSVCLSGLGTPSRAFVLLLWLPATPNSCGPVPHCILQERDRLIGCGRAVRGALQLQLQVHGAATAAAADAMGSTARGRQNQHSLAPAVQGPPCWAGHGTADPRLIWRAASPRGHRCCGLTWRI